MIKVKLILLLLSLLLNTVYGQDFKSYNITADSLFKAQKYSESAKYYEKAFASIKDQYIEPNEYINAAKAFSLSKNVKEAANLIIKAIDRGGISSEKLLKTQEFKGIQSSKEWRIIMKNAKNKDRQIDVRLSEQLQNIGIKDQLYRKKRDSLFQNNIKNDTLARFYSNQQYVLDSINLMETKKILDKIGFPTRSQTGKHNTSLFYVIQHAKLEDMEKYYPLFEAAAESGNLSWRSLCLMTDRIKMKNGLKQIYGTQVVKKDGVWVLYEVEDFGNLNKRRLEIGLEPIEEYAKFFGVKL